MITTQNDNAADAMVPIIAGAYGLDGLARFVLEAGKSPVKDLPPLYKKFHDAQTKLWKKKGEDELFSLLKFDEFGKKETNSPVGDKKTKPLLGENESLFDDEVFQMWWKFEVDRKKHLMVRLNR
ncbi:unnamed protein product [Peronospora belbahrii]|uniref:Uncharacterized protein n=1 Tax=Peronospora belbahrii TaxID=622444 RepID=A0ABN8CYS2_9STRA|nr:unnamed protein product [Peronospora belbahrii]